jgi:hypothetical protein
VERGGERATTWSGRRRNAPHHRILVPLTSGEYEVTGAIRTKDGVRLSETRRVRLEAGQRITLDLRTSPAAGLVTPGTSSEKWNDELALLEREFPGSGVVEDPGFRFMWLANRTYPTTWWVPPGHWTLVRRTDGHRFRRTRVEIDAPGGRLQRVIEDASGLHVASEGGK